MVTDLPDYTKREVLVIDITDFPQEVMVDHRKIFGVALKTPTELNCLPSSIENIVRINHEQIKGLALKDPTVPLAIPVSWEGPYLAYEPCLDAWKTQIVDWAAGTLDVNIKSITGTVIGAIDLAKVLGATLAHSNPVISRLTDGAAFIDPRDVSDRAARLLGIIYGDKGQLAQRTTSLDAYVALRYSGAEIDPRDIRALTVTDIVTAKQSDETLLKATVTQASKDRTVTGTVTAEQTDQTKLKATVTQAAKDRTVTGTVTAEQATAASLKGTVYQSDETLLKATVTQASKDRTISDITKTTTIVSIQATAANNTIIQTPTAGKKIRVKLIDVWNNGTAAITVYLRFAAAGTARFKKTLNSYTGFIINLIGTNWEGSADEALIINLSAAGTVDVTVMKDEV